VSALVRWLPELAVATADDIARFGPNAARVQTLLEFLTTMSNDAVRATDDAWNWTPARQAAKGAVEDAAGNAAWNAAGSAAGSAAGDFVTGAARQAAWDAATSELVSDLISPENYRILTNPLAIGRAVDVLKPRYKNTAFRELLEELGPKSVITQPTDVLAVGRIARSPEDIREIAMTLIADGVPVDEAYQMARLV